MKINEITFEEFSNIILNDGYKFSKECGLPEKYEGDSVLKYLTTENHKAVLVYRLDEDICRILHIESIEKGQGKYLIQYILNRYQKVSLHAYGNEKLVNYYRSFGFEKINSKNEMANFSEKLSNVKSKTKLPEGTFTNKAATIKKILVEHSKNKNDCIKKINFYINRAGKNLKNKTEIMKAKKMIENMTDFSDLTDRLKQLNFSHKITQNELSKKLSDLPILNTCIFNSIYNTYKDSIASTLDELAKYIIKFVEYEKHDYENKHVFDYDYNDEYALKYAIRQIGNLDEVNKYVSEHNKSNLNLIHLLADSFDNIYKEFKKHDNKMLLSIIKISENGNPGHCVSIDDIDENSITIFDSNPDYLNKLANINSNNISRDDFNKLCSDENYSVLIILNEGIEAN